MAKSAEEKAREWLDEQKRLPRPGSRFPIEPKRAAAAAGVELSGLLHVSPGELAPHPLNQRYFLPETEDYFEKLTADIKERGILVPLICRMDGVILAGHNRWKTARELGLEKIPVQKVIDELSLEKEKEFLIKDNLLRRQLSSEEKKKLILELYGEELFEDRRGGDRGNQYTGGKSSTELLADAGGLADKIEAETGIKAGTAKRIIAGIRKERKPKPDKRKQFAPKDKKRYDKLKLQLRTLDQVIASLKEKMRKTEQEKNSVIKELRKLGEPELIPE